MTGPIETEPPKEEKSIWAELRGAGLPVVAGFAILAVALYGLAVICSQFELETLGHFGDSFGALTSLFNALAFAAVVATVVLQSRELRDSRRELAKQAEAQRAWADAAARQIELTKQLEAVRIRPFIKAEWHREENEQPTFSYRVRNVGLGVGILLKVDLRAHDADFGTVEAHGGTDAPAAWRECLSHAVGDAGELQTITLAQFDDLNRALAPGEAQALAYVSLRGNELRAAAPRLRNFFRPVVHFQSVDGQKLSTLTQFEALKE